MMSDAGIFCDPQLGCSDRVVAQDLSDEHAWQLSQEFRLASKFSGPLNFSIGGGYLHYETEENYYVFINALTLIALSDVITEMSNWCRSARLNYTIPGSWRFRHGLAFCLTQPGFQDVYPFAQHDPTRMTIVQLHRSQSHHAAWTIRGIIISLARIPTR